MKPYVGVNYFSGWWRETPNKWLDSYRPGHDWREDYTNRIPLNGCFVDQKTMDLDILTASQYGIDFFQMLWYPVDSPDTDCDELHRKYLNEGIRCFCASPYNDRMQFMVEYCNHPPFAVLDEEQWLETCRTFAKFFAHPSYFTVNGKVLFKIHGFHHFLNQCGGDLSVFARRVEVLRQTAREIAGKDLILCAGIVREDVDKSLLQYLDVLDFYAVYMDLPLPPVVDTDYDYEILTGYSLEFARECEQLKIPMMPYYPTGWNPRPWHDPRPSFCLPGREDIRKGVEALCSLIRSSENLGLHCDGQCLDAFTIYAWNEFGEGGYLAPTLVEYDQKLQGLKQALDAAAAL